MKNHSQSPHHNANNNPSDHANNPIVSTNPPNSPQKTLLAVLSLLQSAQITPNPLIAPLSEQAQAHLDIFKQNLSDYLTLFNLLYFAYQHIQLDSRKVQTGDIFVLLKGVAKTDADQAAMLQRALDYCWQVDGRAVVILSEIDPMALDRVADQGFDTDLCRLKGGKTPILYVGAIREFLGSLLQADYAFGQAQGDYQANLAETLPFVVAVTGTNGKTTISQLVAQLGQAFLFDSAVMGTAGNGRLDALQQASHTTADALAVQTFLHTMAESGVSLVALEASSHGLDQRRLQGVPVEVAIFSNLSRDHLDYHADMAEYAQIKARLFDRRYFPSLRRAVINLDDDFAPMMLDRARQSEVPIWTYSLTDPSADFYPTQIDPSLEGVNLQIKTPFFLGGLSLKSPLLGRFNVANLLASLAGVLGLLQIHHQDRRIDRGDDLSDDPNLATDWISKSALQTAVAQLHGASGRMQRVPSDRACFIVDYAHTPDALTQVLNSLKPHCTGDLWAVFGCGGDRDRGKRPLMAQAGLAGADRLVLTSDNPRSEDPKAILADMQQGMTCADHYRTHIEIDRKKAIAYAVWHARPNDIVVIAGKGHETYQEINGVRYDFDDRAVLSDLLNAYQTAMDESVKKS